MTVQKYRYCMSFTTGYFLDFHLLKCDNKFWFWLIRTSIFIFRHWCCIWMTKLATSSATPWVKSSFICKCDCVCITTSNLTDNNMLKKFNKAWCWLVWVALNISGQILHTWKTKLTTSTRSPTIYISFNINSDCVSISTSNLVYSFVSKLLNFKWIWLNLNQY